MKKLFMVLLLCVSMFGFCGQEARAQDDVKLSNDASDFVLLTDAGRHSGNPLLLYI